jgi:hypothetical protein
MASTHTAIIALDDGREVFQSYGTTVAAFIPGRGMVKTDKKFSVTTSRHVNEYTKQHYHRESVTHDELLALTAPITSKQ